MTQSDYKYDVAFSFVTQDEGIVAELNNLLKGRLKTFLYSERQKEVAGTDGEKTFGDIFLKEARTVVVLYRKEWGSTPWTRIEETAIRNRAHDQGYDFTTFIPMDSPPTVPSWLPKTRIWISHERWGTEAAAAVIEARAQEFGSIVKVQTASQRALELSRRLAIEKKNAEFLRTDDGVNQARDQVDLLFEELESVTSELAASQGTIKVGLKKERGDLCRLSSGGYSILVQWVCHYSNSLDDSALHVSVWKGEVPLSGEFSFYKPQKLSSQQWHFCLSMDGLPRWKARGSAQFTKTSEISKWIIEELLGRLAK